MGTAKRKRKAAEEEAAAAAAELAKTPFYKRYWKQLASMAVATGSIFGWVSYEHTNSVKERAAKQEAVEHEKYGSLYSVKDRIPEAMLAKNNKTNIYDYEVFLSGLEKKGDRYQLKVYIGKPPFTPRLALQEVPERLKAEVKRGLDAWGKNFDITYVNTAAESNLRVYAELFLLHQTENAARGYLSNSSVTSNAVMQHYDFDFRSLGNHILIDPQVERFYNQPNSLANDIVHEMGHVFGLVHTDFAIEYDIFHNGGYKSHLDVPNKLAATFALHSSIKYPNLYKLTVMTAAAVNENNKFQGLAEFDDKAIMLGLTRFKQKQASTEISLVPSKQEETTKWREQATAPTPIKSLNATPAR